MATSVLINEQETFFLELSATKDAALLLDYDGTLAPFQVDRQSAVPYPGVMRLIASIVRVTRTKVAFITGRPAMELHSLLPIIPSPEIWGSHGLERLKSDGRYELAEIPIEAMELLTRIDRQLEAEGLQGIMEMKPGATAVHWRGLDNSLVRDIRKRVSRLWLGLQPQDLLMLSDFSGGVEFRLRLKNKGDAVKQILSEFGDALPVAYLGDDYTDEDAFRVLKNRGLSVLVSGEYRSTAADIWLRPPEEVMEFFETWLLAFGREA